jgi:hypothetical protein
MPNPKLKALHQAETKLQTASNALQTQYFDAVWRSISGSISNSGTGKITAIASNNIFVTAWKRIVGRGINDLMKSELKKLEAIALEQYAKFDPQRFNGIQSKILQKLTANISNFSTAYANSLTVAAKVKSFTIAQIAIGLSFAESRGKIENYIKGTPSALGVVDNFNLVENRVQDKFAEYDRRLNNEFASELKLNYAIYQGGEIKTTRDFCNERNGNVYNREQIDSWNGLVWDGKNLEGNVFTDAGGYNCRHYYDWISYELAVQLDPKIERSKYDL